MSEKKLFEIWCEGDLRHDFTAAHLGYGKGVNLFEACEQLTTKSPYFSENFNPYTMSYHGCSLFDNEIDARRKYG